MLDIYILCEYNILMMNIKCRILFFFLSFITLFIGFSIYIFLRDGTYIHLFLEKSVFLNQLPKVTVTNPLTNFLGYYFVDFLWGLSLSFFLTAVAYKITFKSIILISAISSISGVVFELGQCFSVINGTADFIDVSMYLAASVFCAVFNIVIFKKGLLARRSKS